MEESNKIVVKVKYQAPNDTQKKDAGPAIVTEWHKGRVFVAIAALLALLLLSFYFFSNQSIEPADHSLADRGPKPLKKTEIKQNMQKAAPIAEPADITVKKEPAIDVDAIEHSETINPDTVKAQTVKEAVIKKDIITEPELDSKLLTYPKIVRTLLTSGLNNKEPVGIISSTVSVYKDRASKVYYFTEIIDMKGQVLYHRWLRNDQLIFKKEINILGNRWRASTSKLITYSKAGLWAVRLEDEQGVILNEIKFEVTKE